MAAILAKRFTGSMLTPALVFVGLGVGLGWAVGAPPVITALASDSRNLPLAPPGPSLAQTNLQGDRVTIGDMTLPIPWQQRGDRIGMADIPLMRHLGLDLQNTSVLGEQPILWFSEDPQVLPTWHANGYRYLDITDWAATQNWSLQPSGNHLQIRPPLRSTPIQAARRGRQPWGDRLVLEVDQPVAWVLEEDVDRFNLRVLANPAFDPLPLTREAGNRLNSLQVSPTQGSGTLISGTFDDTARVRVWSLTNPYRIVIDITETDVVPRDILWAPGVRWREAYVTVNDRPFPVHQIWLDPSASAILQPIWPNPTQLPGIAPLSTTARNWGAAVAINAGFFNRNNQLPLGAVRNGDRWISGPILNRGVFAWNNQGQFLLNRLALPYTLTTDRGNRFTINPINSGYVQAGIGLYTPDWGGSYTPVTDNEVLVTVSQHQVIRQSPTGSAGTGTYPIPADGYLLAVRSFSEAVRSLPPRTTVSLTPNPQPPQFEQLPFAIGGGPILVKQGQIVADARAEGFSEAFATQAAPRSAIGVTPNGQVMLVAIHYSPGGRGPTLTEAAQILRQLGAQDALNLDGGTSSSLYLGGSLINRHPATVGRVHNGLGIFLP